MRVEKRGVNPAVVHFVSPSIMRRSLSFGGRESPDQPRIASASCVQRSCKAEITDSFDRGIPWEMA